MLVLIVIAMLALGAYAFTNLMLAHKEAALVTGRQAQARALVDSGVTAAQLFLALPEADQLDAGGWFDNPGAFSGITVVEDDDPLARGVFSVVSPNMDSEGNLYTADVHVGRPQKFRPKKGADPTTLVGRYMRGTTN